MKDRIAVVALVAGGGEGNGKAVALALAARGAKVVVVGGPEKALGETVGEIAFGGGKARHYAGDDPAGAVEKAAAAFGTVDFVMGDAAEVEDLLPAAKARHASCEGVVLPLGAEEAVAVAAAIRVLGPRPAP